MSDQKKKEEQKIIDGNTKRNDILTEKKQHYKVVNNIKYNKQLFEKSLFWLSFERKNLNNLFHKKMKTEFEEGRFLFLFNCSKRNLNSKSDAAFKKIIKINA